jgi:hypothetical protein
MDYFSKYLKYKHKYNNLKNQLGGTSIDETIQTLELTDLYKLKNQAIRDLEQIIPTDRFINLEEIVKLIDDNRLNEFLENIIINYIYKQDEEKILDVYTNPDNFFNKLHQVVTATHNIWIHLNRYIETNDHTVLLIPGDSPTYFLFLLKILYPEILTNPKVTIVVFPISKLSNEDKIIEFIYDKDGVPSDYKIKSDGKPYLKFIFDNNIPQSIRENPHQFVIIDYLEAGRSVVFIEHTIKELYEDKPYRINKNFVKVINLKYYFVPTSEIQGFLLEYNEFMEKYNEEINSNPNIFNGLIGAKQYEKFLFANWYLYLDNNFLEGLEDFTTSNSLNVLMYLVDDSDRRCQYKISLREATKLTTKSTSMADFISKIENQDKIYTQCNIFNILLYLICNHYQIINSKCAELVKKLSDKIISLIPLNTPVKLIVIVIVKKKKIEIKVEVEKIGQIIGYSKLNAKFKNLDESIELIGLLDIKSIISI